MLFAFLEDSGLHTDYVPNDEETQALSKFLSELSLTDVDENEISLSSENMPEEFHLVYNRYTKEDLNSVLHALLL